MNSANFKQTFPCLPPNQREKQGGKEKKKSGKKKGGSSSTLSFKIKCFKDVLSFFFKKQSLHGRTQLFWRAGPAAQKLAVVVGGGGELEGGGVLNML